MAQNPPMTLEDLMAPGGVDALIAHKRMIWGDLTMEADGDSGTGDQDTDGGDADEDQDTDDGSGDADGDEQDEDGSDSPEAQLAKVKEALRKERKLRKDAEKAAKRKNPDTEGDQPDDDKLAEARREAEQRANQKIIKAELKAAAKGLLADPTDVYRYLDLDDFDVDEDGNVDSDEMEEAIEDLLKEKPYLAANQAPARRFQTRGDGGSRGPSRPKQLTSADIERMSPKEIDKATREGRLDDLLKGKR